MPSEYVSGLRLRVNMQCETHHSSMEFVPANNGGGIWRCQDGCMVTLSMRWGPASIQVNHEAHIG